MMVAIHLQRGTPIPLRERRARQDANRVAVFVVVLARIDVLELRVFLLLHIAVQSAAINYVEQLRSAANAQDGQVVPQGMAHETHLDLIFQWMSFFEIT